MDKSMKEVGGWKLSCWFKWDFIFLYIFSWALFKFFKIPLDGWIGKNKWHRVFACCVQFTMGSWHCNASTTGKAGMIRAFHKTDLNFCSIYIFIFRKDFNWFARQGGPSINLWEQPTPYGYRRKRKCNCWWIRLWSARGIVWRYISFFLPHNIYTFVCLFLKKNTLGYSGSDIKLVCKESAMRPLRRLFSSMDREFQKLQNSSDKSSSPHSSSCVDEAQAKMRIKTAADFYREPISMLDAMESLKCTRPSCSGVQGGKYTEWQTTFGSL